MKFRYDKDTEKLVVVEADKIEYTQMNLWLCRHVKGYQFNPRYKMRVWNGKIDYFNKGKVNLGLWKECFIGLNEIGHKFEIENKKDFPLNREVTLESVTNFCMDFFKDHKIETKEGEVVDFMPYDYQIETAYKILKNRYCIGEVATSGGKSLILSIIFFYIITNIKPDAKFLLIVPSISLVTQFYDNLVEYNEGFNDKYVNKKPIDLRIQEVMSDKPRKHTGTEDPNIYISTYQSLSVKANWPDEFFEQFHTVAVDESHQAKIKSLISILERTVGNAYYRFGVSGTFPEPDTCEILTIQNLTGPKVTSIKAKTLQDEGKITNVEVKQIILNHDDPEFEDTLRTIRKNRNNGAKAYQIEGKYVRDSEKRYEFIRKVVDKCKGNTLLLFNIVEYGEMLLEKLQNDLGNSDDIEFMFISGKISKKKRGEILTLMDRDDGIKRVLIATYGTLSTGVSVNNLYNVIFAESFKSEVRIIQSIGRALRKFLGKERATIFDLVDCFVEINQKNAFFKHGKERISLYEKHSYPYKVLKYIL